VTGTGTLNINNDITTSGGDVDITTANGLLQTSVGSDVNASGGAGVAAVRLESLNGIADLVTGGSIASGSGGVRIAAGNNVTLSSAVSASGGPVILAADSNAGGVGTLTLNSAVSATGAGTISLTGLNFAQSGTGTVTSSGGSITVSFVSAFTISRAISSTSGSISISGGAVTLNAATSGGGGVSIIVPSIIGNAGGTITAQVKPITLMGSIGAVDIIGSIQSNGGNINVTAGTTLALGSGLTSSDGGVITLTSAGNMTLFGPMTTSGGAFNADVTGAGTLSIQNDISTSGADVDITTANGLLQTTAGSDVSGSGGAGSAAVRLEALNGNTDLTIASAITSGSGGVRLAAGNHVTVSGVVSGGGGPLTLAAETNASGLGTLTLNSAVSTTNAGAISLSGHGFVQAGTGTVSSSGGNITSHIVTAFSVSRSISSTSGVISMTGGAATLNASISGGGGVSIIVPSITGNAGGTIMSQAKPITLTGSSGAVDIIDVIDSNGGNISVNAATTLDLGSGFMSSGGGVITLTSVGNMALSGPMTTWGGAFNADVTSAGSLSIQNDITTSGGDVDITTANGLLQTSAGSDVNANGSAGVASVRLESLHSASDLLIVGSVASGSGGVRLAAGNHVTVSGTVSAGTGPLTLAANTDFGLIGNLTLNTALTAIGAGTISLAGADFVQNGASTVTSSSGNITARFMNVMPITRAITSTSGAVNILAAVATLNAAVTGGAGVSIDTGNLIGNAGGTVTAQNHPIILTSFSGFVDIIDVIDSNGGNITVSAASTLELGTGLMSSGGGVITLTSVGNMTLFGPITTWGGAFNADVTGTGTLSIQNDISTSGGNVDITTFNGLLQTTAGSDVNGFGGAGSAAVRLESLGGSADLTTLGAVYGGTGGTRLAARNHVTLGGTLLSAGGLITLAADTNLSGGGNLAINSSVTAITSAQINLSGVAFSQAGTGTIASAGGNITGTFRGAVNLSKNISSNGGGITFTTPASLAVNAVLSKAPPAGGTGVLQATNSVVINTAPVLGNANIVLISGTATAPVLGGASVSNITTTAAKLAGNVTSDGSMPVMERGFVYSPTLANANPSIGGPNVIKRTVSGTTGGFAADLTALSLGTSYSFKAYAINFIGTTYSSPVVAFSTSVTTIGQMDETYQPTVVGSRIFATAVQADGKTLIGGNFSSVGGESHNNIARLNADGSVDTSFQAEFDGQVLCIALRDDGKILVGGDFLNVNGKKHSRIVQLKADGSLDDEGNFNPDANVDGEVISMMIQPDGSILIGGRFSTVNDFGRNNIARLTADGFFDDKESFNQMPGTNGAVLSMALQSDGRIVIGGEFTEVNKDTRNFITRLMPDGSVDGDDTLNQGNGLNDAVSAVTVQADGKSLTGKLVIAKAPLFVTPSSHRRFIGQANPAFTVSYSGFVGGDIEGLVFSTAGARLPVVTTTAKTSSPAGTYPITAKDLLLVDYTPIYLTGSLIVESFAGSYETLLTDTTSGLPAGKVEFTIGASSTALTGKLILPSELTPLPFTGTLNLNVTSDAEFATGNTIPIIKGVNSYVLELALPFGDDFTTRLFANASITANASSSEGRSLFLPAKDQKIQFAGAHTLILGSALPASTTTPLGSGHATATIDAKAMLKIAGRLADGTTLTATLAPDAAAGYRLFAQPYNRLGSYLAGWLDFEIHPTLAPRVYLPAGATDLVWRKAPGPADKGYRSGFGPVATSVTIDPWFIPTKTTTLATLLELPAGGEFNVTHSGVVSASSLSLPTDLKLDSANKLIIIAPITLPPNATKWNAQLDANTGAITGSFTLTDQVPAPTLTNLTAKKNVTRLVPFAGTLRQPHGAGILGPIGAGFFLVPALPTDPTNEFTSGTVQFTP
jgi:uncharacterized delta-60 repeat protein